MTMNLTRSKSIVELAYYLQVVGMNSLYAWADNKEWHFSQQYSSSSCYNLTAFGSHLSNGLRNQIHIISDNNLVIYD